MENLINKIKMAIERRYNPTGEKTFEIAFWGSFSGPILSENVVLMVDSDKKRLYITHPSLLYHIEQDPLISVIVGGREHGMSLDENAKNYPEILKIWKEELMGN